MDESYICNLDPETKTSIKIYLVKNVQNVEEIHSNLLKGVWKCAVIKASLILHPFQIVVAVNKAVLAEKSQSMVTRTVYAEILYNLSLSKNISQSLSKFGVQKDENLLVCFLVTVDSDESGHVMKQIIGEVCSIDELEKFTNIKEIKTVYKLNNLKSSVDLIDIVVSKMVSKRKICLPDEGRKAIGGDRQYLYIVTTSLDLARCLVLLWPIHLLSMAIVAINHREEFYAYY